jgi:hypothetical protein
MCRTGRRGLMGVAKPVSNLAQPGRSKDDIIFRHKDIRRACRDSVAAARFLEKELIVSIYNGKQFRIASATIDQQGGSSRGAASIWICRASRIMRRLAAAASEPLDV